MTNGLVECGHRSEADEGVESTAPPLALVPPLDEPDEADGWEMLYGDEGGPVSVIEFRGDGPLAKHVWAEEEDDALVLRKKVAHLAPKTFTVRRFNVGGWAHAYADLIGRQKPDRHLVHASVKEDGRSRVTTKVKLAAMKPEIAKDFIARGNDCLERTLGPGIMLIDTDEPVTAAEFAQRLAKVLPGFESIGRVSYASSGSHIYTKDGRELRGATGLHTAILVEDATDIERAGKALAVRLALAGDYRVFVSEAGRLELRTIIDPAMLRPSQPELASDCFLDNERSVVALVQRRPAPVVREGPALDTRAAVPLLTSEEKEHYRALVGRVKKEHAATIEEKRTACRERITAKLVAGGVEAERAAKVARGALEDRLVPPATIQANDGTEVPVAEILAAPHARPGWAYRDPLEPEYGTGKAKVYVEEDGSIIIRSFAHGGRVLRVGYDAPTVIEVIKKSGRSDLVDLFFADLRQHFVGDEAGLETVWAFLADATKTPKETLRRMGKEWARKNAPAGAERQRDDEDIEIAERVRDEVYGGVRTFTHASDQQFHRYDGKCWRPVAKQQIESEALKIAIERREDITIECKSRGKQPPAWNQTVTVASKIAVEALARLATHGLDFSRGDSEWPALLNFQNGTLDLATMKLRRHNPRDGFTYVAPIEYDPDANSPTFDELLSVIWPGMPEVWRHFEEVLGYAIQSERFLKLIVVAWGGGYNGKSPLFFKLPRMILGDDAVGVMHLKEFKDNRFATADPVGKNILVEDDLDVGTLWPDGQLKKMSERALLRAEPKHVQAFSFVNNAVPIILGNNVAYVRDPSLATAERIQAFKFERSFKDGTPPYDLATAERLFKAVLGDELPGVLNRLIAGFLRVKARPGRGGFDTPKECIEWRDEYLRAGNRLRQFMAECSTPATAAESVDAAMAYERYQTWFHESGAGKQDSMLGRNSFYERLREAGYTVRPGHADAMRLYGVAMKPLFEDAAEGDSK
jgi:P4 family phage/plasmid primase-like protien